MKDNGAPQSGTLSEQQASTPAMSITDVQTRIDALGDAMLARGLPRPSAEVAIRSATRPNVCLYWKAKVSGEGIKFFHGDTVGDALTAAEAFVATLPSAEKARVDAFLASLDETIQLGKKADVEVEAINPLLEIFKRISKNAITHQVQA